MKKHFTKIILIALLFVSNQHAAQSLFSKKKKPNKEASKKDKEGIKPYEKALIAKLYRIGSKLELTTASCIGSESAATI